MKILKSRVHLLAVTMLASGLVVSAFGQSDIRTKAQRESVLTSDNRRNSELQLPDWVGKSEKSKLSDIARQLEDGKLSEAAKKWADFQRSEARRPSSELSQVERWISNRANQLRDENIDVLRDKVRFHRTRAAAAAAQVRDLKRAARIGKDKRRVEISTIAIERSWSYGKEAIRSRGSAWSTASHAAASARWWEGELERIRADEYRAEHDLQIKMQSGNNRAHSLTGLRRRIR